MQYKRYYIEGGIYFITLVTYKRHKIFVHEENIELLRQAFRYVKKKHDFTIEAIVILPDHIHLLMALSHNDFDFSTKIRLIKSYFSRKCAIKYKLIQTKSRKNKKEQAVWQRRFWDHCIRNDQDFANHVDYIHYNPVHHNFCLSLKDWVYSSFHTFVRKETYEIDWGACEVPKFENSVGME